MTPYTGLFGALKVADDVEVGIDATLPSEAATYEELAPRELKPALLELEGISRLTVLAHYKLYEGYVEQAERDPRRSSRRADRGRCGR